MRKERIPENNRYCLVCNDNLIGDEKHFLLYCTNVKLLELRNSLWQDISLVVPGVLDLPTNERFLYLFSGCDLSTIEPVCRYSSTLNGFKYIKQTTGQKQ